MKISAACPNVLWGWWMALSNACAKPQFVGTILYDSWPVWWLCGPNGVRLLAQQTSRHIPHLTRATACCLSRCSGSSSMRYEDRDRLRGGCCICRRRNAVSRNSPTLLFPFCQANYRYVTENCGLAIPYRDDPELQSLTRRFWVLALSPIITLR